MRKKEMKKETPKFPDFTTMTYEEEAHWWDTHDMGEYWGEMKEVDIAFELHKPKTEKVIVRLQKNIKDQLEKRAKAKGITVSTLTRMWLLEKLMQQPTQKSK